MDDQAKSSLHNTMRELCDKIGVTPVAKDIGWIDEQTDKINSLATYKGMLNQPSSFCSSKKVSNRPLKKENLWILIPLTMTATMEGNFPYLSSSFLFIPFSLWLFLFLNSFSRKKQKTSDSKEKGLRHFSKKVCEKVASKRETTYNEVADELVLELNDPGTNVDSVSET